MGAQMLTEKVTYPISSLRRFPVHIDTQEIAAGVLAAGYGAAAEPEAVRGAGLPMELVRRHCAAVAPVRDRPRRPASSGKGQQVHGSM